MAELPEQIDHLSLTLLDIGDDLPSARSLGRQADRGPGQIRSANAALLGLFRDRFTTAEIVELRAGQQHHGGVEPEAQDGRRAERLARLCSIGDSRVERVQGELLVFHELAPLVGIHEVARIGLCEPGRSCGEDVLQTIQDLELSVLVGEILDLTATDEPIGIAGQPPVAKR